MQRHAPIKLSRYTREVEAVAWSADNCIACTTFSTVYVLMLKAVASGSTPSGQLPFSMTTAELPTPPLPPSTSSQSQSLFNPCPGTGSLAWLLDPLLCSTQQQLLGQQPPWQQSMGLKETGWTPTGCALTGGCLLSCLASNGCLWLLTPPGCQTTQWNACVEITATYKRLREEERRKRCEQLETPDKAEKEDPTVCSTFHWLPYTLPAQDGEGRVAVVAIATRCGAVAVLAMAVPVNNNKPPQFWLVNYQQLVLPEVKGQIWPCRLRWNLHNKAPLIAVGLTDGQLIILHCNLPHVWRREEEGEGKEEGGEEEEGGYNDPMDSVVLWPQTDGMAVRHIAWLDCREQSSPAQWWVVFSKSSTLVAKSCLLSPSLSSASSSYIPILGVHSSAVSGLSALPQNTFLSCSLDGSVQTFQLPSSSSSSSSSSPMSPITPSPITASNLTSFGAAASPNGLFGAIMSRGNPSYSSSPSSFKQRVAAYLHIIPVLTITQLPVSSFDSSWDICEAVRLDHQLPDNIKQLLLLDIHTLSQPLLRLKRRMRREKEEEGRKEEEEENMEALLMLRHVSQALEEWKSLSVLRQRDEEENEVSEQMSVCLMCQWVESCRMATPTEIKIARKVRAVLQNETETELCPICKNAVPLTGPREATCSQGHTWGRCCRTLLITSSAECSQCRGCLATAHNPLSLHTAPGSWLRRILSHVTCTYCTSHFEWLL